MNIHSLSLEIHSGEVTRKQPHQKLSFLHVTRLPVLMYVFTKYFKPLSAQEFCLEIYSVECSRKRTKQELSFLHVALLLDLIYAPPKYYQIISGSMGGGFRGDKYITKTETCLFCTWHAYLSFSMPLPNIIKYFKPLRSYRVHKNFAQKIHSGVIKRMRHAKWSLLMPEPIIKIFQTI